jgi:hypothetical protein
MLDSGSFESISVRDFGSRWSKVTLIPTIADQPGREVPFSYTAEIE